MRLYQRVRRNCLTNWLACNRKQDDNNPMLRWVSSEHSFSIWMQMTDVQEYDGEDDYDNGDNEEDDYEHDVVENNDNVPKWTVFHLPYIHTYIQVWVDKRKNRCKLIFPISWCRVKLLLMWRPVFSSRLHDLFGFPKQCISHAQTLPSHIHSTIDLPKLSEKISIDTCLSIFSWQQYDTSSRNMSLVARLMGPTWGPPGSCRPQVGPMQASWTLLSGVFLG